MLVRWYYQNQAGVVGPVTEAELSYLFSAGTLGVSTLVRRGDDGPWLVAQSFESLLGMSGQTTNAGDSAPEIPEWHFSPKGQNKQGPVNRSVLKDLIAEGKLQPDDLVWKPGMAMWVPVTKVDGLLEDLLPTVVCDGRFRGRFAWTDRRRVLWAGVGMMTLLGLVAFGWARTRSSAQPNAGGMRARVVTENGATRHAGLGEVEQLLADALTAIRLDQLDRALSLLNQYLDRPQAQQPEAAKLLLREIKHVTSTFEAAALARDLADEPLRAYLRQGVEPLVAAIETVELRPIYERTLLQAFRQENNRRQMIPRGAFAQNPAPADAGAMAKNQDEPERPAVEANPNPREDGLRPARGLGLIAADMNGVLDRPNAFLGKTLLLNGLFKIGTKISEVKGQDGQALGWSLPIARNDDSAVFTGDRAVNKGDAVVLLDDRLAAFLQVVFNKFRLGTTIKPSYKCILTVTVRGLLVNGAQTPVVVITSMEVLGGCDYLSVARHQYSQAFRTLTISADEADVDFGDGDLWVERLGGEDNFVQPIRRRFREMQRRAVTDRDAAVIDSILRRELASIVSTATAINHIVAIEGLRRMRILP